ncbi:MAG: 3-isopropylmalate dehydratase [Lentisphaeria bacterium]|nr:3-isopropylmalate dehydratase [Lentisphaeria bacterium]
MADVIRGKVFVVGDNIDTDQIIPAEHLSLVPTIPEEYAKLGSLALSGLPAPYPRFVPEGRMQSPYSIVVAGRNFGCGSSREHAPISLGAAGVRAVLAESYARIFFRNAIATGELYPVEVTLRLCEKLRTGDTVELDLDAGVVRLSSGEELVVAPLGDAREVIRRGGLFEYARATGMIR